MPDLFVADTSSASKTKSKKKDAQNNSSDKMGLLTTFCRNPKGITFENQEVDEEIMLFLRRHIVTNVPWVATALALLLFPIFLPFLMPLVGFAFSFSPYWIITLGLYYLVVIGYAILQFTAWFYNVGIVTNLRVVDIDINGITNRNIAAAVVQDLVDVEYSQRGFIQSFFDYGNVHMQTEGLKPNFEFLSVPKPAQISDIISGLMQG
ncbi:MAG: hypothetical protein HY431_01710 [Candidatus Levybacteria bacterium]|nr:hypothetical protein [Candidatus Levybacteria bacterium]